MSGYTVNGIYTVIAKAIESVEPTAKCYGRYTETVEKFPAAFIYAVDIAEPTRYRTLAVDSSVWNPTYEIQLFSNLSSGAVMQTQGMADAVFAALRSMAFRVTSAHPVPNGDPSIYRYVIRATRLIGGADEMPQTTP